MLMAQTICDQNFKCASAADIMGRMKTDCVNTNLTAWQFLAGSIGDGQTAGRLTYDAATMGTCIAKLAGQSCSGYAGCAVAPITARGTVLSVLALALAAAATRRRKR